MLSHHVDADICTLTGSTCDNRDTCLQTSSIAQLGHDDLAIPSEVNSSCINLTLKIDGPDSAGLDLFVAPPTRAFITADTAAGHTQSGALQAPPTSDVHNPDTCSPSHLLGHDELYCFDAISDSDHPDLSDWLYTDNHTDDLLPTLDSPTALHTGWPLSSIDAPFDDFTRRCLYIYDRVRSTGVPNFLEARLPLPHQLNIPRWRYYLDGHTNISLPDYLEFGFPVGFHPNSPLESTIHNHASALLHPTHVQSYLAKEVACQAMLGPFSSPPFWPWYHLNPILTRPKKDSHDRRVILDLSWPHHASVNGGTQLDHYMGEPYKLLLPTTEDFAQILAFFGQGTFMWSLDLSRAFRQIRLDPLDWPLIGIEWQGSYYTNISVAFGVRHGAAFAQRLSQAVCDVLAAENITTLPYIDDYIGAHPAFDVATASYDRTLQLFHELGLALNPAKCITPTTHLTWIGVTFNSTDMTMRIPTQVILDTKALVNIWLHKLAATRHELQTLLGKLFYAGKCCPPARLFVGRMLETLRSTSPSGSTPLTNSFRADLQWWRDMLPTYNGRFLIQLSRPSWDLHLDVSEHTVTVHTDTHTCSATVPLNIITNDYRWAHRECYAILLALTLWGSLWQEAEVVVFCIDPTRLQVLVHGRSRHEAILRIARRIWLLTAAQDICLQPTLLSRPIPTDTRTVAAPDLFLE